MTRDKAKARLDTLNAAIAAAVDVPGRAVREHSESPSMNVAEALAREIYRVARVMVLYEEIGAAGRPALLMMRQSMERAFAAAGSGEALDVIAALQDLKGYGDD